jgi:carboxyl-terminal processing protease
VLLRSADTLQLKSWAYCLHQVNRAQRTLVEAWGVVRETYVDTTFNNQDWEDMLQSTLADTFTMKTSDEAYSKIRTMLASLDDPFTRIVTPQVMIRS